MFQETYRDLNDALTPSPVLVEETLAMTARPTRRSVKPIRRMIALAAVLALLLSTTALAAQTEPGYQLLYAVAPAAAQFFQPVQRSCTANGVTMEVISVHVEGDTAQAYVALSGGAVDETVDMFDSFNFHLPLRLAIGHCERISYDETTHTAVFLCSMQSTDGTPIPTQNKMTFSVGAFLSGKEKVEDMTVDLNLSDYAFDAETATAWGSNDYAAGVEEPKGSYYRRTGGGYMDEAAATQMHTSPMLLPGPALAEPVKGLSITAAGYADGLFHIQLCRGDATATDNHGYVWLEDADGNRLDALYSAGFTTVGNGLRVDYDTDVFDVPPEDLQNYTLHGYFVTASNLTEGPWRITFPLENF